MTYQEFINNILQTRGRFACGDEYHERHHIIPRCKNGLDDDDNLIDLFAREHFIAHKLLAEENMGDDQLVHAYMLMAFVKDKNQIKVLKREMALILPLVHMERTGYTVNKAYLIRCKQALIFEINGIKELNYNICKEYISPKPHLSPSFLTSPSLKNTFLFIFLFKSSISNFVLSISSYVG